MDDFEAFVRTHGNEFARLAFLLSADRGHAEDLVQSALLNLHKRWAHVSAMERPVAYVRTMIAREYLSWRRRRYTTEIVTDATAILSADPTASDHADTIALRAATWASLSMVSRRQRTVLVLRYYLDLSYDDIADILGCSTATARSHATRGLKSLRASMDTLSEETLT